MRLIIFGGPASGRSTQAEFLAKKFKIPHISAGDLLQDEIKAETEIGKSVKDYVNKGHLVPIDIIFNLISDRLNKSDAINGFVLDGFPRDLAQAKMIENLNIDAVINIKISDKTVVDRISNRLVCSAGHSFNEKLHPPKILGICDICGHKLFQRSDDNIDAVQEELKIYRELTHKLKYFYVDKLITVDGEKSIKEIQTEILKKIRPNLAVRFYRFLKSKFEKKDNDSEQEDMSADDEIFG